MKKKWWQKSGIQFQCQGSGNCCVSRGEYGYVYLTRKDRVRMAQALGLSTPHFTKEYCKKSDGIYHLIDGENGLCRFLENHKCSIYEGRPTQCRTWPFWPEVMEAKVWKKEVAQFCPGVGKGPTRSPEQIQEHLEEQLLSEEQLGS